MRLIRPIRAADLDALVYMAKTAGAGFTSLPPVAEFLAEKIALSERSFAAKPDHPGHERYMFVLEETTTGDIGGCCAIEAACGLDEPFYNYHLGTTVHASHELHVYNRVPTLYLSNDLTGTSVLCSLYLRPDFAAPAPVASVECRFMLMAQHPQRFSAKVIAEMRGVSDEHGRSPFWEGLGRHFFSIDYDRAEHLVGMGNKAIIAELMPKHPIYTNLLSPEASGVIGKVHKNTQPALHLLEGEGFRMQGYVDIFDGGPTVEAPLADIRTIRRSRVLPARVDAAPGAPGTRYLVADTEWLDFRCVLTPLPVLRDLLPVTAELAAALGVADGASLRVAPLE